MTRRAGHGERNDVATSKLISQGHDNFELIFMMLMGIRTSVGKFANVLPRGLGTVDFDQKWDGDFLSKGSADTPGHKHHDFRFKDYCPLVFREIRERFSVTCQDYLLSLTSEYVLVEMFTNSKSGSFFFYSADYRYILKTCSKREAAFLLAALPQYHAHLMAHRYTLLCRFFGLHRVHLPSALGRKVYFVVMGNVFPIDKPIHERFDLKGSTRNRHTTEAERHDPSVVLKDLDWIRSGRKLHLGGDNKRRLLSQVNRDCALLERLEVIDYSLLVGIHHASASPAISREREASRFYKVASGGRGSPLPPGDARDGNPSVASLVGDAEHQRKASVRIVDTVSQQQIHREHQQPSHDCSNEAGAVRTRAERPSCDPEEQPVAAPEVGKETYFVGCIDILCEYGLKKQLEHRFKAAKHGERVGSQNFSVVDPLQYSLRFQNFVADALD